MRFGDKDKCMYDSSYMHFGGEVSEKMPGKTATDLADFWFPGNS